jgi:transposase
MLQTVQGVGSKVAQAILSSLEPGALATAIGTQDKAMVARAPGVGPKLLPALLTLLMKWHAMTNGKGSDNALVSYVGLDSKTETSGRTVRGSRSISKKGDPEIRRLLYMGALGATTGKNVVRQIYSAKIAAGKPPLNALVACARRLLVWAWKIFQSEQAFDPSRILKPS